MLNLLHEHSRWWQRDLKMMKQDETAFDPIPIQWFSRPQKAYWWNSWVLQEVKIENNIVREGRFCNFQKVFYKSVINFAWKLRWEKEMSCISLWTPNNSFKTSYLKRFMSPMTAMFGWRYWSWINCVISNLQNIKSANQVRIFYCVWVSDPKIEIKVSFLSLSLFWRSIFPQILLLKKKFNQLIKSFNYLGIKTNIWFKINPQLFICYFEANEEGVAWNRFWPSKLKKDHNERIFSIFSLSSLVLLGHHRSLFKMEASDLNEIRKNWRKIFWKKKIRKKF